MQYIGKIDKNKIGEYKDKILTEEVFLSYERINHIKEHHPEIKEEELKYIKNILEYPDYIFKDRKNNDTILFVKNVKERNKGYTIVLKLNTNKKVQNKANTIISLWSIGNKKLGQIIRNEQIIFKNLDRKE